MALEPDILYVDARVRGLPLTHRILDTMPNVTAEIIHELQHLQFPDDFSLSKQRWLLQSHTKKWFRVESQDESQCVLHTDFITNAPYDCSYCTLPLQLRRNPLLTIAVNIESALAELATRCAKQPGRRFVLRSGELGDPLAVDHLTGICAQLMICAGDIPNLQVELRTRTTNIDHLFDVPHHGRSTIIFAITPESVIEREERGTAALHERFAAAKRLVDAGFRVGFAIDPIFQYANWETEYELLIEQLCTYVPHEAIAHIELSCFHYPRGLDTHSYERFPQSQIFFGELVPVNGCFRYLRHLRQQMYQHIHDCIVRKLPSTEVRVVREHGKVGIAKSSEVCA